MRQGLQAVALLGLGGWMVGCALTTQADATAGDAARADEPVVTADAAPTGDAAVPTEDAAVTPDAVVDPSAPESIVGRWRAVRYRSQGSNGQVVEVGDNPVRDDGSPNDAWINGMLEIASDRLLIHVTQLGSVRLGSGPIGMSGPFWRDQLRRTPGRLLPRSSGFVFEDTTAPGAPSYPFSLDADGTLWLGATDGLPARTFQLGFVRDPSPMRRTSLVLSSEVEWRSEEAAPQADLQPALFWDAPGAGFLVQRLATGPWAGSSTVSRRPFTLALPAAPPSMYQTRVGGIAVAVAPIALATDSHRDAQRIPRTEVPSPALDFVVVWRGEGPDAALRDTPFEGLVPGYSFARVPMGRDDAPGAVWLAPLDNTHLVPINVQLRVPRTAPPPMPSDYTLREVLP